MARVDFNKLADDLERQKYVELYRVKPWSGLPRWQRLWLIRYYKLRSLWGYLGYSLDSFPRLRDGPIIDRPPWQDRHHPLNRKLQECEDVVRVEFGPSWIHWKSYRVEYHFITDLKEVI